MSLNYELIRNYAHRMFLSRASFVEFFKSKDILLPKPKSGTYEDQLRYLASKFGEKHLLDLLGLNNEDECKNKIDLISILVEVSKFDLSEIATNMKIPIDYKMNRGNLTRLIIVNATLDIIKSKFIEVAIKNNIIVVNEEGILLGPEWITNLYDINIDAAKAFISFSKYLDEKIVQKIGQILKVEGKSKASIIQKVISTNSLNSILAKVSDLIIEKKLSVDDLKGDYTWDIDTDFRYGMRYSSNSPIINLCDMLLKEYPEPQLDKHLGHSDLAYSERMLIFCIENNPFNIIEEHFSTRQLEIILKDKFLLNNFPEDRKELINLLLFNLGFNVPEQPKGIRYFENNLRKWNSELRKEIDKEILRGISTSLFIELEKLVKDMIYYYCGCIIKYEDPIAGYVFGDYEVNKFQEKIDDIWKQLKGKSKTLNKATLGELIGILSAIDKRNKNINFTKDLLKRDSVIPHGNKTLDLLNEINGMRKFLVHDSKRYQNEPTKLTLKKVIEIAVILAKEIKTIYPTPIIVSKLETTGYKTTYMIAKDEEENDYKVYLDEYLGDGVFKDVYLMAHREDHIIVNPILVKKL